MKWGIMFFMALVAMPFVLALQGPITVNGLDYFVVTSVDPTEDTGNEVCAKLGQTCVGYTEYTGTACRALHGSAKTVSGLSGDKSTVYCDGSPQTGVCQRNPDTCVSCPTCSVSVQCDTPIGNLYREMYVECQAPQSRTCPVQLLARDTDQFFNEIPSLNSQLPNCPTALPSGAGFLVGSGNIQMDITRNNGRTDSFTVNMQNKQAVGISKGTSSCSQKLVIAENVFNRILASRTQGAEFMRAYANKEISVSGCTTFRRIVNFFFQPITRWVVQRNTPPPPPPTPAPNCGGVNEQCNNRACQSGLTCASPRTWQNGRWQSNDFRCIGQRDYDVYCTPGNNAPSAWDCLPGSFCR